MSKESYVLIGALITSSIAMITSIFSVYWNNKREQRNFKRDHNYSQLKELYIYLYGVVVQSEYLRHFHEKYSGLCLPFWEYPFIEIGREKAVIKNGKANIESIEDVITQFNKEKIAERIIDKGEYASQDLIKLAVAYRYSHANYLRELEDSKLRDSFQIEEVKLIYLIVKTIIKESNEFLKECNMPFDGKEISYGVMNHSVFDKDNNYYWHS